MAIGSNLYASRNHATSVNATSFADRDSLPDYHSLADSNVLSESSRGVDDRAGMNGRACEVTAMKNLCRSGKRQPGIRSDKQRFATIARICERSTDHSSGLRSQCRFQSARILNEDKLVCRRRPETEHA